MTVSADFHAFVLEQLEGLPTVSKRMFGGIGIYAGEDFFAIVHDDRLYFKVDESTRPSYVSGGMAPFSPFDEQRPMRGYFEVPVEVLEDADMLCAWAREAVRVARLTRRRAPARR